MRLSLAVLAAAMVACASSVSGTRTLMDTNTTGNSLLGSFSSSSANASAYTFNPQTYNRSEPTINNVPPYVQPKESIPSFDKNVTINVNITIKPATPSPPSKSSSSSSATVKQVSACSGAEAACCSRTINVTRVGGKSIPEANQICTYQTITQVVVLPECSNWWDKLVCNPCSYCGQKAVVKTVVTNTTVSLFTGLYPPAVWTDNKDSYCYCANPKENVV